MAALAEHTGAIVVEAGENLGFARGVNRGVSVARGKWILLLNPDAIVEEGAVDAILGFATVHPEFGMYGGRTLTPAGAYRPEFVLGRDDALVAGVLRDGAQHDIQAVACLRP